MFQSKELELLRLKKKQLALQSEVNRLRLMSDWQHLRLPDGLLGGGLGLAKRHPVVTAALAAASGFLATKILRRSGPLLNGFGRVGEIASVAFTAWKLFQRTRRERSRSPTVTPRASGSNTT
jgi:hypothetical protein